MSILEDEKSEIPNEKKLQEWIDEGKSMIYPEKYQAWEDFVRKQVNDLYGSMPVEAALSVMRVLESGLSIEEAKKSLNCSGAGYGMVRAVVLKYSNRGPEFWRATADSEISLGDEDVVRMIEWENLLLSRKMTQPKVERPDEIKIQQWIDMGKIMIYPEKHQDWEEFVKRQAHDQDYEILNIGKSLETTLKVIQALEEGLPIEEAKKRIDCSGYAYGLLRESVVRFSSRGPEFWRATADCKITTRDERLLRALSKTNDELRRLHSGSHK